jgi:hypothetical protein
MGGKAFAFALKAPCEAQGSTTPPALANLGKGARGSVKKGFYN